MSDENAGVKQVIKAVKIYWIDSFDFSNYVWDTIADYKARIANAKIVRDSCLTIAALLDEDAYWYYCVQSINSGQISRPIAIPKVAVRKLKVYETFEFEIEPYEN